jgi:Uma2 family endonuclease
MDWQQLCEDKTLHDLPYKIESNNQGQIIMSPASVRHVFLQAEIISLLRDNLKTGKIVPEFPVETTDGVKVADVAWLTIEHSDAVKNNISSAFSPAICVEVLSRSNTAIEMEHKKALYFEKGAKEFWLCKQDGLMSFYNKNGQLEHSTLVPGFPLHVAI